MSRDYIDQSNGLGNALTFSLTQFLKLKCKNWAERENSNSRKSEYRHTTINSSNLALIVKEHMFLIFFINTGVEPVQNLVRKSLMSP